MEKEELKALVLAGGYDQIALIKELKEKDYKVILADYLDNPPAKKEADCFYQVSTLDEKAIYEVGKTEDVDLIITACTDQALLTMANVSAKLGLPCYLSVEAARDVTNKFYMKKIFEKFNIPSADYIVLENDDCIDTLLELVNFPYVVKPCDCNSSKGVIKVEKKEELIAAVKKAFCLSRSRKVVVENYLCGTEVSIDVWIKNKNPQILLITETKKMNEAVGAFTIYQSKYPVLISKKIEQKIQNISKQICDAFLLENGPMLIQAVIKNDEVYVLEFGARMGGGSKYKLIEQACGINIMKEYVEFVLDKSDVKIMPLIKNKMYEMDFVYANNGTIREIIGLEQLKNDNCIREYFVYKENGSVINQKLVSGDRVFGVLLEADSKQELYEKRGKMLNYAQILDEYGNDIMYRSCFCDKPGD